MAKKNQTTSFNSEDMTIVELANNVVEISTTSNGKRSFKMGNNKYVQFKTEFDPNQYATAGNQAFSKARNDENMLPAVDPDGVSAEAPLVVTSQQIELMLPSEETSMDNAIKVAFLIAQATGLDGSTPIENAFTIDKYGVDKIQYTFTDGGQWPI